MAGFPHLFVLVGLNTELGQTSPIYMIESQVAYALAALPAPHRSRRGGSRTQSAAAVQPRRPTAMRGTEWTTGGCARWYLDAHGHNTTVWPTFT
ncbi:MAG: hypothetical protein M3325_02785 [Actinomycetota bacterium]|nr:hypothetical protein [Actinomycetota bacterium]